MNMLQGFRRSKRWSLFLPDRRVALVTDPEPARVREEEAGRILKLLDDESDSKAIEANVKAQQPLQITSFEV